LKLLLKKNEDEGYIEGDKGREKNMDIVSIDLHLKNNYFKCSIGNTS
jgi:tmRNA-binding protein